MTSPPLLFSRRGRGRGRGSPSSIDSSLLPCPCSFPFRIFKTNKTRTNAYINVFTSSSKNQDSKSNILKYVMFICDPNLQPASYIVLVFLWHNSVGRISLDFGESRVGWDPPAILILPHYDPSLYIRGHVDFPFGIG